MHFIPSSRALALTLLLSSLTASTFAKTPTGINCKGKGCSWNCDGGCSQAFSTTIAGLDDTAELHDGQLLACMEDIITGNGMCATVYGMGDRTTTGANIKLVAQDLANHCGACGSAPVVRDNGNKLSDGWLQIEAVGSDRILQCNMAREYGAQFNLCRGWP